MAMALAMAASGGRSVPDSSFEFSLERMFAETPARPDADFFAARVLERLDRGWTARRLLIGSMGALGGLVGAYQILGGGALTELRAAATRSNDYVAQYISHDVAGVFAPAGFTLDSQAIWMAAALALVAAGFGLARLVREI
jgi:hypothetical protein